MLTPNNMCTIEEKFLLELEHILFQNTLYKELYNPLHRATYHHFVLGLIYIKYTSESFDLHQNKLKKMLLSSSTQPNKLELKNYCQQKNFDWLPIKARWTTIHNAIFLPRDSVLCQDEYGQNIQFHSIHQVIFNAFSEMEKLDQNLKGVFNRPMQYIPTENELITLIKNISKVNFSKPKYNDKNVKLSFEDILKYIYGKFIKFSNLNESLLDSLELSLEQLDFLIIALFNARKSAEKLTNAVPIKIEVSEYAEVSNLQLSEAFINLKDVAASLFEKNMIYCDIFQKEYKKILLQQFSVIEKSHSIEIILSSAFVDEILSLPEAQKFFNLNN